MPAIFISHSSVDKKLSDDVKSELARLGFERVFLDFDKATGLGVGDNWEKRLYEELTRCHAVMLVLTPAWLASKWCFAEMTQARALGKVILPVMCEPLGDKFVLPDIQAVDLVNWNADGLARLEQRLRAIANELARGFTLPPGRAPYPGISAFEAEDAAIYFGRDEETRALIERLDARRTQGGARCIVIIGASGSGKSSLLKASVLPQLGQRRAQWVLLPCIRPEKAPLEALAKALAQHVGKPEGWRDWRELGGPTGATLIERLVQDARIADARSATVLLPIDQFEEVFTTTSGPDRAAFLGLLASVFARDLPFMVVATGRSDVLEGLLQATELVQRYETYPLPPMPLERVPRLVEGPAAVAGLYVEKGLPDRIVRDVESTDALPLLAHMLSLLYGRGVDDKKLSVSNYDALGDAARGLNPIQNSVRLAADEAMARLQPPPNERETAALRDAFVPHLVRVRIDDGKRVRQPARRTELPAESLRLIGALTEARLLSTRQDGGDTLVEVTHEALFKAWPTIDQWLTEEQTFLTDLERIRDAHENWAQAPADQKSGELVYGLLLSRAREWLLKYPQRFVGRDMEALRAYVAESAAAADAERERQRRKDRLIFRGTVAAAGVFFIIAAVAVLAFFLAYEAQKTADREANERAMQAELAKKEADAANTARASAVLERKRADAQRNQVLITQSRFLADQAHQAYAKGDNGTALALLLEALPDDRRGHARPYVPAAESLLYEVLLTLREERSFRHEPYEVDSARFLPDGQRIVTFSTSGNTPSIRNATSGKEIFALHGHTASMTGLTFSPDQQQIVTTSRDGTARSWNMSDGMLLQTFKGHDNTVWSAAFSPNGRRIVTASDDGTARIWVAADDTVPPKVLPIPDELLRTAVFSADGNRVATASFRGPQQATIRLWDAAGGTMLAALGQDAASAYTDGRHAVTSDNNTETTLVWDVMTAAQAGKVPLALGDKSASFSPDGRRIALAGAVWEAKDPPSLVDWKDLGEVVAPVFSPNGHRIAGFSAGAIKIFDADQRSDVASVEMGGDAITRLSFSPDGQRIVTVHLDRLSIWNAADEGAARILHPHVPGRSREPLMRAAFSPDGRFLVTAPNGNAASLWDTISGALLATREYPSTVWAAQFLPGSKSLVTSSDQKLWLWDATADSAPMVVGEQTDVIVSLDISPDGRHVVTGDNAGGVRIWDLHSKGEPVIAGKHPGPVLHASFSPDGRQVLTVSDTHAFLWDGRDGSAPARLGNFARVRAAAFSPAGGQIVIADNDGMLHIADAQTHLEVKAWRAHSSGIEAVSFSPDGTRILTAARDNAASIWDVESGEGVAVLRGHSNVIRSAAFSSDGLVVTASWDRTIRLWPAFETTQALVDYARARMPRELTPEQRRQFFLDP